jgi:hypothetical protein
MNPRPSSLKEVAERSESIADFGRYLRDWLHELRRFSSRAQIIPSITDEPERLHGKFEQGHVADAWLAAYAEHLAARIGIIPPPWAFAPWRISSDPIFDEGATAVRRELALLHAPLAFKRRNIFTPSVDLPLSLRAGRPAKSILEKRKTNAERQRRFRKTRAEEVEKLRAQVRDSIGPR